MHPSFSVVITCYNYCQFVAEAIDSALSQIPAPLEVIVVDDGSCDGSAEYIQSLYAQRPAVRLLTTVNQGQLAAFASGGAMAKGDVICFLDADDHWQPGYLDGLAAIYRKQTSVDFVFTQCRYFGGSTGTWHQAERDRDHGLSALDAYFRALWIGSPTSGLSIRRKLCQRFFVFAAPLHEDWRVSADEYLVRAAMMLGAHQYYWAAGMVNYRIHSDNHWFGRQKQFPEMLQYQLKLQRLVEHLGREAGMTARSRQYALWEFKTKPQPTAVEFKAYAGYALKAPIGLIHRLRMLLAISWHYLRRGTEHV